MKKMDKEKELELERSESSCCGSSQETCCDQSQISCCNATDVQDSKQLPDDISTTRINKESITANKLKLDIYVPLEACSCQWTQFMNLIFSAITPYIKHITHETKSLNSGEARALNLTGKCVIVDNEKKYTTSYELKKDLPLILEQKGLL